MKDWSLFFSFIEQNKHLIFQWFNNDQTRPNLDKFQSIALSRHCVDKFDISLDGHVTTRGNTLKILGVTLDNQLNFNEDVRIYVPNGILPDTCLKRWFQLLPHCLAV